MGVVPKPYLPEIPEKNESASHLDWFCIIRSDDAGESWTKPVPLFRARYNANIGYVKKNGRIYCCFDRGRDTPESYACVVAGDLGNLAMICSIEDDSGKLDYRFLRFQPWPGAYNHFHLSLDQVSGLYWMTGNLIGESAEQMRKAGMGGRRILALHCSVDSQNWIPAGYVIIWPLLHQSSNYCGLLIDGDDLLVAARTSRNDRSHHDNDLTTFHRIRNFRERWLFARTECQPWPDKLATDGNNP